MKYKLYAIVAIVFIVLLGICIFRPELPNEYESFKVARGVFEEYLSQEHLSRENFDAQKEKFLAKKESWEFKFRSKNKPYTVISIIVDKRKRTKLSVNTEDND